MTDVWYPEGARRPRRMRNPEQTKATALLCCECIESAPLADQDAECCLCGARRERDEWMAGAKKLRETLEAERSEPRWKEYSRAAHALEVIERDRLYIEHHDDCAAGCPGTSCPGGVEVVGEAFGGLGTTIIAAVEDYERRKGVGE